LDPEVVRLVGTQALAFAEASKWMPDVWMQKLIERYGDGIRPYLEGESGKALAAEIELWHQEWLNRRREFIIENLRQRDKMTWPNATLTGMSRRFARTLPLDVLEDVDKVVDAVHIFFQRAGYLEMTRRDVEAIYSGRGVDAMKRQGLGVLDPASGGKAVLEFNKTWYRNALADLELALEMGERAVGADTVVVPDEELAELEAEYQGMKERYDFVYTEPGLTDGQRAERLINMLVKEEARLRGHLIKQRLRFATGEVETVLLTRQIERLRKSENLTEVGWEDLQFWLEGWLAELRKAVEEMIAKPEASAEERIRRILKDADVEEAREDEILRTGLVFLEEGRSAQLTSVDLDLFRQIYQAKRAAREYVRKLLTDPTARRQ